MMNVDKDREARRSITECTPMTHVYVGSLPDDAESHHHCTTEMAEEDAVLETAKGRHTGTPAEKAKAPGRITLNPLDNGAGGWESCAAAT